MAKLFASELSQRIAAHGDEDARACTASSGTATSTRR